MRIFNRLALLAYLFYVCNCAFSATGENLGIGVMAQNIIIPISVLSDFINTACIVLGGAFIFASVIKYFEHRRSPLMVPISTVVFLVIAGLLLILLPFLSYFVDNGLQYSLINNP